MAAKICMTPGTWENAVIDVIVAGDPPTVHGMAKGWKAVSGAIPGFGTELRKLVDTLTAGSAGWHGKAADEYEKIVTQITKEMRSLEEDAGALSTNLTDAANVLSDAISRIPVPLMKEGGMLFGTVSHKLPGGTDMDENKTMHAHQNTFIDALRNDYVQNKASYRDFMHCALIMQDEHLAGQLRSGVEKGAKYQGEYDKAIDWYNDNAGIAQHHFHQVKTNYTQHRGRYQFRAGVDPLSLIDDGEHPKNPPPSGYDPSSALTSFGATGPGTGSAGSAGYSPDAFNSPPAYTDGRTTHTPSAANAGHDTSGSGWSPDSGSSLAGSVGPGGLGSGGLGTGGGLGGGGSVPGLMRAGSASSGPELSPTPPLTAPPGTVGGLGGPNARTAGTAGARGMGMMPAAGTHGGNRDDHQTWLTEDEDYWGTEQRVLPRVIGSEWGYRG